MALEIDGFEIEWQREDLLKQEDYVLYRMPPSKNLPPDSLPAFKAYVQTHSGQEVVLNELQRYSGLPHSIEHELDARLIESGVALALESFTVQRYDPDKPVTQGALFSERLLTGRMQNLYLSLVDVLPEDTTERIASRLKESGLHRNRWVRRVLEGDYLSDNNGFMHGLLGVTGNLLKRVEPDLASERSVPRLLIDMFDTKRYSRREYEDVRTILQSELAAIAGDAARAGDIGTAGAILAGCVNQAGGYDNADSDILAKLREPVAVEFKHSYYSGRDLVDIDLHRSSMLPLRFADGAGYVAFTPDIEHRTRSVGVSVRSYNAFVTEEHLKSKVATILRTNSKALVSQVA